MLQHTCGDQRAIYGSQLSPSTMYVPGVGLRSSGLAAGLLTSLSIQFLTGQH